MSNQPAPKPKQLTGEHVLIAIISFFVVLFIVNGLFVFAAVGSFRGEDVKGSYRQGLEYNETLADREAQAALGWEATVAVEELTSNRDESGQMARRLVVRIFNDQGELLSRVTVQGRLRHPIDTDLDIPLNFTGGLPASAEFTVPKGRWTLEAKAVRNADHFDFRKELLLE